MVELIKSGCPMLSIDLARAVIEGGAKGVKSVRACGGGSGRARHRLRGKCGALTRRCYKREPVQSQSLKNLFRVLRRFYFGPNLPDPAVGSDQEGYAMHSLVFDAHEFLFAVNAVGVCDRFIFIGEE